MMQLWFMIKIIFIDKYWQSGYCFIWFSVPEYEVVSIRSRSKRSIDEDHKRLVSFNAFGKDVKLQLRKNPHLVKQSLRMWIAEPDSSKGIHYKELTQVRVLIKHLSKVDN